MAKSHNKKEVEDKNKIDELNEHLTNAGAKIAENKKTYGWIIVGVLVVASLVCGLLFWWLPMYRGSSSKIFAKTEQLAYQAMMKENNPNDSVANAKLLAEYEKVIKSEGNKVGGNLARIAAAEQYYDNGQYQKTIDYLNQADIKEPVLKAQCEILIGDSYVGLNNLGEALKCYDKAVSDSQDYPMVAVRALLKKALVLDEQKKYSDALAVYKKIKSEFPLEMEEISMVSQNGGPETVFSIDALISREEARLGK